MVVSSTEVVIAPPALYLLLAREHLREGIEVAAQNVFDKPNGAFTGEISAEQLKDSGIWWVLTGHSERRVIIGEQDAVSCHPMLLGNEEVVPQGKQPSVEECATKKGESPSLMGHLLMETPLMQFIASKTQAALDGGLSVILCVGETLEVNEIPCW